MKRWATFKKIFLLMAVIVMLLSAWPTRYLHVKPLPPLEIKKVVPPPVTVVLPVLPYEESYYDVKINDVLMEESVLVLKDKDGALWVPVTSLVTWNFIIPNVKPLEYLDNKFLSLNNFPGVTYTVDMETLTLNLTTPITVFKPQQLDFGGSKILIPTLPPWGGYLNYDIFTVNQSNVTNSNALFGITIFSPYGYGTSSFTYTTQQVVRPFVRLLTTWVIDKPDVMKTLSIGDTVSTPTNWSGSLNYGGIQWGTNFNTQPAFFTFPLPGYRGTAIVPSTIDMFVNNAMVRQEKIAPGVFDISNIPMVDGAGNVYIIVKDILGRRQLYKASYYINTQLLKKGLSDYTYDLGLIRQDLGVRSNVYSQALGAITYGYGLTDFTTGQAHLEVLSYEQAAGLTLTHLLGQIGTLTGSIAGSRSIALGRGALAQLAFQHQGTIAFGGNTQYTTTNFTQSGVEPGQRMPKLINQLFAAFPIGNNSLSFNWTQLINRNDSPNTSVLTGSYSGNLWHAISVSFTMVRSLSGPPNRSAILNLSYSFDPVTSIYATYSDSMGSIQKSLQLVRQLPVGPGYGYDATLQEGATDSKEGSFSYQNDIGTYVLQAIKTEGDAGTSTYSLDVSGGFVYMDKFFKMSRTITNSFGLVKTSGFPNIDIYSMNQLIGTSDTSGVTFVPNLLPYQETTVYLDPNTVPLNAEIDSFTTTVVPYANSGVLIPFNIKTITNAIVVVKFESGEVLPEGSVITVKGNDQPFLVGLNGEAFFTGIGNEIDGDITLADGKHCVFHLAVPTAQAGDPIPNLGTVTCKIIAAPIAPVPPPATAIPKAAAAPAAPVKPIAARQFIQQTIQQGLYLAVEEAVKHRTQLPLPTVKAVLATDKIAIHHTAYFIEHTMRQGLNQAVQHAIQQATMPANKISNTSQLATHRTVHLLKTALQQGFYRAVNHSVNLATQRTQPIAPFALMAQNKMTAHDQYIESILKVRKEGMYYAINQAVQHATA